MPPWLFAIPVLLLLVVLVRNAFLAVLARVPMLPGEELLFEREGLVLLVEGADKLGQRLVYRTFVRVTDRRVIVGTGSPKKPRLAQVRYVVLLDEAGYGQGPLDDGFVTFPARRADVEIVGNAVRLKPTDAAAFEIPRHIAIECASPTLAQTVSEAITDRARAPITSGRYRR